MEKLLHRKNLKLILFLTLVTTTILWSCKKLDTSQISEKNIVKTSNDFFIAPSNISLLTKRVFENIKVRNAKHEFTSAFVSNYGLPVWDKVLEIKAKRKNGNQSNFGCSSFYNNEDDTIIFIPLVLSNETKVNGFIKAIINDSINLSFSLAQDYKNYPFTNSNTEITANKYSSAIMYLDKLVFGRNEFTITDKRLFNSFSTMDTANIKRTVTISDDTSTTNLLALICYTTTVLNFNFNMHCTGGGDCDDGTCDLCELCVDFTWSSSNVLSCAFEEIGGSGGGPSGGGGGGGGNIPHYFPCIPVSVPVDFGSNNILPGDPIPQCPSPNGGTGWIPPSAPFQKLCINSFNFIAGANNSHWETNVSNLKFESGPNQINTFSAYYFLGNDITDYKMNLLIPISPFGPGVPPKSALDYWHDFFPLLFSSGDIVKIWDPSISTYVWRFSKYATQLISAKCSNIAARNVSLQFYGIASTPGFVKAHNAFRNQTTVLLKCFFPSQGTICRALPSTSSNTSMANYSIACQ